ncbi:MAG: DUF3467 domain-containing protein, partial [Dehalococcoidia bacterium]
MAELTSIPDNYDFEVLKDRPIEWLDRENLPYIYANHMELKISLFDIWLDLGVLEEASEERLRVRPAARVILSPQIAKVLMNILNEKMSNYEQVFG